MLDHYTEDARQVVFFARYQASRLQSTSLLPEHLWLGVLRQNRRLLRRLAPHITPEAVDARLAQFPTSPERLSMTEDLPLSPAVQRILTDNPGSSIKVHDLITSLLREDSAP